MEIKENNSLNAWKATLKLIMNKGEDFIDHDKRVCRELLNVLIIISSPEDIDEPIDVMKGFKEFVYPSKEELKNTVLNKVSASNYGYSYGFRLFNYRYTINQIDNFILPLLKKDPKTRRGIAVLYDPLIDSSARKSGPGLVSIHFKIHKSKLNVTATIRSNDYFIGFPANIYQISIIQNYLAEKLKIDSGEIAVLSTSAHIFKEHFEMISDIISD